MGERLRLDMVDKRFTRVMRFVNSSGGRRYTNCLTRSMTSHVLLILQLSGLSETSTTTDFQSPLVQSRGWYSCLFV